jgi:hypothetical protein
MDDWLGLFSGSSVLARHRTRGDKPGLGLLITGERAVETAEAPVDRAQEGLPRLNPALGDPGRRALLQSRPVGR